MKRIGYILLTVGFGLIAMQAGFGRSIDEGSVQIMDRTSSGTTHHGMPGMDMETNQRCPEMMNFVTFADGVLLHQDHMELSSTQIDNLEKMRAKYQEKSVVLTAELNMQYDMMENAQSADEINGDELGEINGRITETKRDLRDLNIKTFASAARLLTTEQINHAREMGVLSSLTVYCDLGMSTR